MTLTHKNVQVRPCANINVVNYFSSLEIHLSGCSIMMCHSAKMSELLDSGAKINHHFVYSTHQYIYRQTEYRQTCSYRSQHNRYNTVMFNGSDMVSPQAAPLQILYSSSAVRW